jgi:hypothetical protein
MLDGGRVMSRLAVRCERPGGESSDHALEADVMRFVAIIALCIVAISTLVEDAAPTRAIETAATLPPPTPAQTAPPMVPAPPASPPASVSARAGGVEPITPEPITPEPITPEPITPEPITPEPITPQPITPEPITPQPVEPVPIEPLPGVSVAPPEPVARLPGRPTPAPDRTREPAPVAEAPPAPPAAPESPDESAAERPEPGFVLRFASDAALLRLVARGEAAVYVFDGDDTLRLEYGASGASFALAPGPAQYHAIAAATVPGLLRTALAGDRRRSPDVVWGVTLPDGTRRRLAELISNHRSGELVIDERGRVTLETSDG